jgi:hypothetical protein
MKEYEEITIADERFLKVTEPLGKVWFAETKETSSLYAEYLRYTEWVEAGNDPEDFWTQTPEL